MMLPSNPGVLDRLIRDRQEHLRTRPEQGLRPARSGIRVRIGHALIAAGSTLSGERVEHTAPHSASPRTA
jgi:hypothetical protein